MVDMLPLTLRKLAHSDPQKAQALGKELIDYVDSLKSPVVESMKMDAIIRIREKIAHLPFEMFCASIYDSNKRFLTLWEGPPGCFNECTLYLSSLLKDILNLNGCSVYLAHNHPNGSENPSQCDKNVADVVNTIFRHIGININHLLITPKNTISF